MGNDVANSGTVEALGGTLALGGAVTNTSSGFMTAGTGSKLLVAQGLPVNDGTINLTGGTYDNNNQALTNNGQISGYGTVRTGGLTNANTMTLTGATTTVNGGVTNNGMLNVAYDPAIFTGDVVNNAMIKTTATTATFAGGYTENGVFISDPSTNTFWDWTIGESGVVIGGEGDLFKVGHTFINHSLQNTVWDTALSELELYGASMTMDLAGADYGASYAGYTDNFAWGIFQIDDAITDLTIGDGVTGNSGAALYVGLFEIDGGLTDLDKIISDFNIYYDADLTGNDWLGGQSYALNGSGFLMPVSSVPLPGSIYMFLIGTGLLGLIGRTRRKAA